MLRDISGAVTLQASAIAPEVFHVSIEVRNTTICHSESREDALLQAMVSAHVIAHVSEGEFVSLLEPRGDLVEAAAGCRNTGVFPVLAGVAPEREFLLISPINLYDYPQVAPESLGDFNDATEIDEMLTLRVLTLTDQEKEQMRAADPKARAILEQSCGIGEEQFLKLHGAVRGLRRTGGKP
jgi:hydrogenase maturation protease